MSVVASVPRSIALQPQNPGSPAGAQPWDADTVYTLNQIVSYAVSAVPSLYVAVVLETTAGTPPATADPSLVVSAEWRQCATGEPMWLPGQSYYPGDVVAYATGGGGTTDTEPSLYLCLKTTSTEEPPPAPIAGFTSEYWKLLVSSGGGTVGISAVVSADGAGVLANTDGGIVTLSNGLFNGYGISIGALAPPDSRQLSVALNYFTDYGCGVDILSPASDPAQPLFYSANLIPGPLVNNDDPESKIYSVGFGGGVEVTRNTTADVGTPNASSREYATSISLTANLTTANGCGIQTIPSSSTSGLGLATSFTTANGCGISTIASGANTSLGFTTNFTTATGCGLSLSLSDSTTAIGLSANLVAGDNITLTPSDVSGNTSITVSSATPQLSSPFFGDYEVSGTQDPVTFAQISDGFTADDTFSVTPLTDPRADLGPTLTSYHIVWNPSVGWQIIMTAGAEDAFTVTYRITALTKGRV